MAKRGRPTWTTKLDSAELQILHEWIDANEQYGAADLHRLFGLKKTVTPKTFRNYVRERRESAVRGGTEAEPAVLPPRPFSDDELDVLARGAIGRALLGGDVKAYQLPGILHALVARRKLDLDAEANRRADELHAAKMSEFRKAQEAALRGAANDARLTEEQIAQIRERVLGI